MIHQLFLTFSSFFPIRNCWCRGFSTRWRRRWRWWGRRRRRSWYWRRRWRWWRRTTRCRWRRRRVSNGWGWIVLMVNPPLLVCYLWRTILYTTRFTRIYQISHNEPKGTNFKYVGTVPFSSTYILCEEWDEAGTPALVKFYNKIGTRG